MSGLRFAAAALAVATLIVGVAGPASAEDRDHHDRDRHVRHRHYAPPPPAWGYDQPSYVEAPPPVVYAPPQGPPLLSFGITLPLR